MNSFQEQSETIIGTYTVQNKLRDDKTLYKAEESLWVHHYEYL